MSETSMMLRLRSTSRYCWTVATARLRLSPEDFGRVEPPRQIVAAP